MQARDEDGQAMTDGELRDELVTLLLAGPRDDGDLGGVGDRAAGPPSGQAAAARGARSTPEDGGGEEYMTAVVNETLRVRPVVPIVVRVLQEELQVGRTRARRRARGWCRRSI